MGYAEGYPAVEKTQVVASAEAAEKARQMQSLLGVGEIVEDDTLAADRILVILGKDFSGGSATGTQGTELGVTMGGPDPREGERRRAQMAPQRPR